MPTPVVVPLQATTEENPKALIKGTVIFCSYMYPSCNLGILGIAGSIYIVPSPFTPPKRTQ